MSIWTDMAKYNIAQKEFYVDDVAEYKSFEKNFDTSLGDTDYYYGESKLIATIVPKINGTIKGLYFDTKTFGTEKTGKVCLFEIRDANENVLDSSLYEIKKNSEGEYIHVGYPHFYLNNFAVNAFSPLKVYFQSYNTVSSGITRCVPSVYRATYAIRDKCYLDIIY